MQPFTASVSRIRVSGFPPLHHFVEKSPCPKPLKPAPNGLQAFSLSTEWYFLSSVWKPRHAHPSKTIFGFNPRLNGLLEDAPFVAELLPVSPEQGRSL